MDADFSLFEEAYETVHGSASTSSSSDISLDEEMAECPCTDTVEEHGVLTCRSCGSEVKDRGTKWAGIEGGKGIADPGRCQARKVDEKSIFKDIEVYGFAPTVAHTANEIYLQVTDSKIYRGESRKGIIFSCVFHAFKLLGKPQSSDALQSVFNLDRKVILKGMKHVSLHAPKHSAFRTTYITPVEIVDEIMSKLNATKEQKQDIIALYERVKHAPTQSSLIKRSKPQSVAAGLVFYYISKHNKKITMEEFTAIVGLSDLTISKLVKEISHILDTLEAE